LKFEISERKTTERFLPPRRAGAEEGVRENADATAERRGISDLKFEISERKTAERFLDFEAARPGRWR
jgi:hypothetical protein